MGGREEGKRLPLHNPAKVQLTLGGNILAAISNLSSKLLTTF